MATCAICLGVLRQPQRFLITDTAEVVHRECARVPGAATVGQRLRQELARAQQDAASSRVVLTNAQHDLARVRVEHVNAQSSLAAEQRENRELRIERATLQRQLTDAKRERDAARQEAALHQTINATPGADPKPAAEDTRDPTVVRFSLLDLT